MDDASPSVIASSILSAPAWVRLGIAVPDPRMRERAAAELAASIATRLERQPVVGDPDQLALLL